VNRFAFFFLLLIALVSPRSAYADSDGYYCNGPGYLAYQFGMAAPPVAEHRLFVLRTNGARGIPEPVAFALPQFQVHGIVCGEDWIEVASLTDVYRVTLDASRRPIRYEASRSFEGQPMPKEFIASQLQNLGPLGGRRAVRQPIRISIGQSSSGTEYILEITAKPSEPPRPCEAMMTSRVIETDGGDTPIGERVIFQGPAALECGG
jgi:hypothetical protein